MRDSKGRAVPAAGAALLLVLLIGLGSVRGALPPAPPGETPTASQLIDIANQQLQQLGPNTRVVPCNSSVSVLPPGTVVAPVAGAAHYFPGRYTLADGRCAFDPDVTPAPLRPDSVDGP